MFQIGTIDQQSLHAAAFQKTRKLLSFSRSVSCRPLVLEIRSVMTFQLPRFRFTVLVKAHHKRRDLSLPVQRVSIERLVTCWCCVSGLLSPSVVSTEWKAESVAVGFGILLNCRFSHVDKIHSTHTHKHTHTFSEAFPTEAPKEHQLLFCDQRVGTRGLTHAHTHTHC